jgi:hypothetical protein
LVGFGFVKSLDFDRDSPFSEFLSFSQMEFDISNRSDQLFVRISEDCFTDEFEVSAFSSKAGTECELIHQKSD